MGSEYFETNSLDFTKFWAKTGVNSEVLRGAKLREEKPNCSKNQEQFTPVYVNINSYGKKMHSIVQNSTSFYYSNHRRTKRKSGINTKEYSRCPMRIAELAIPTKRQCLDTWRNRGKTLPNFMVDRLRQHVMDAKPVVHINDAIYCFKSQKVKRSRSNKLKFIKKGNIDKAKLFCAFFGHRIVLKLLPSGRIPVQTSLKNLTEIVSNDIEHLLQRRKRSTSSIHKKIRDEISEKVTVWIASVLDDSEINLMMDDFEDLEEKEGHVWDIIDDLIEAVVDYCKSESISYVEENYPSETSSFNSIDSNTSILSLNKVTLNKLSYDDINIDNIALNTNEYKIIDVILLDIIDSVCGYDSQINGFVQNLLDNTVSEVIAINKEEINTNDTLNTIDMTGLPKMIILEQADTVNESISKDTERIVVNVTDTQESNTSKLENRETTTNTDEKNDFDNQTYYDVPKDTSTHSADNNIIKESNNSENEESVTNRENVQIIESPDNTHTEQIQEDDVLNKLIVTETIPPVEYGLDTNVSTENIQVELKDSDEWPDDSLKKVKFSDTNIGNERPIDGDSMYNKNETTFLHKKLSSSSQRNYFKHINFSPPNTHLLYNVDETWPEDFFPLTTKLSATVSKSVISLGFINEADEKSIPSPITLKEKEQNVEKQFVTELSNLSEEIFKDSDDLQKTFLRNICDTYTAIEPKDEDSYHTSQESDSVCLNIKRSHEKGDNGDSKVILINDVYKSQNTRKLTVKILSCININSEIEVSSAKGLTKEKQIQTDSEKIKLNPKYKPIRQHEVRIMCKGLYNVVINMEKWLNWIICVTNIITAKLRQNEANRIKTRKDKDDYLKEWLQLKNSVDSDRKVWHHLYKRLCIGINHYEHYFKENNPKIKPLQLKSCICRDSCFLLNRK